MKERLPIESSNQVLSPAIKAGHFFFLILIGFSAWFYIERTVFIDCAFGIFNFIADKDFLILNNRFIAFIPQILPVIGVKSGWSMSSVLLSYSLSFTIIYYLYYIITAHFIKNKQAAMLFLFLFGIFINHTFFWIQSEFPQGIMLFFLCIGIIQNKNMKGKIIVPFLMVPIIFSHPLIIFPITFFLLFMIIDKKGDRQYYLWFILILSVTILLFKMKIMDINAYESDRISFQKIKDNLPHLLEISSFRLFVKWFLKDYFMLLAGLIVLLFIYLQNRNYLKFLLLTGFFSGFALIVILSYPDMNPDYQFYFENLYLPLGVFVTIGVVYDLLPLLFNRQLIFILVVILIIFKSISIFNTSKLYTDRTFYIQELIAKTNDSSKNKFVIDKEDVRFDKLLMEWGLPYETILLSSLKDNWKTVSIITTDELENFNLKTGQKLRLSFSTIDQTTLDNRYFNVNTDDYHVLSE